MRALILCAGEGTRLRPLTCLSPKPLVPVAGVPMAVRQAIALKRAGIGEVVINAASGSRRLRGALGDGSRWGLRILWSVEGDEPRDALETLGGAARALPLLTAGGEERFLIVAGDIATDYDYSALVHRAEALSPEGALAHLVLVSNPPYHPQGDMTLAADGLVRRRGAAPGEALTFSSLGAYHASIFEGVEPRRAPLFPWLYQFADAGRVTGERFGGRWANVGTLEELERAEALFAPGEEAS